MVLIRTLIFSSIILLSMHSLSSVDLSMGGQYRSYPIGGGADATLGYTIPFWGSESTPFHGYFRLVSVSEGVIDFFSQTLAFEIFPISFLGVRAGNTWSQSHLDFEDYDCEEFSCRGQFNESFYEGRLFYGHNRVKGFVSYKVSTWPKNQETNNVGDEFIEPSTGLALSSIQKSIVVRSRAALLFKLWPELSIGYSEIAAISHERGLERNKEESRMWLAFAQISYNRLQWNIGAGEFKSELLPADPTFYTSISFQALAKKWGY